jgi:hypothetical protein
MLGRLAGAMRVTYLGQLDEYRASGIDDVGFLPQGWTPNSTGRLRGRQPGSPVTHPSWAPGNIPTAISSSVRSLRNSGCRSAARDGTGHQLICRSWGDRSTGPDSRKSSGERRFPWGRTRTRSRTWNGPQPQTGCGRCSVAEGFIWDRMSTQSSGSRRMGYTAPGRVSHTQSIWSGLLPAGRLRQRIAEVGRAHALAHHTYAHRMALLLSGRSYGSERGLSCSSAQRCAYLGSRNTPRALTAPVKRLRESLRRGDTP